MWDMMTSIYEAYGFAFVVHGLLSFPVFLVSAIGPNQFLYGFYGRFYHGIFSLSTPWLHIRELIIAKKIKTPLKLVCEALFALTILIIRVAIGTVISFRFIYEMTSMLLSQPVHSQTAFVVSIVSCSIIPFLQLYWCTTEVLPALRDALTGKPTKKQK